VRAASWGAFPESSARLTDRFAPTGPQSMIVPGHEIPDVEHVVKRHSDYFVVEKTEDAESVVE
jgi:hypothetical protein